MTRIKIKISTLMMNTILKQIPKRKMMMKSMIARMKTPKTTTRTEACYK
jgi:hypothetical protein